MNRYLGICIALLSAIGAMGNAMANSSPIELKFSGTLLEKQCIHDSAEDAYRVELPLLSVKYFQHYGRGPTTRFALRFKDCSTATLNKQVQMVFHSPQVVNVDGVSMLPTEGGTGVVLGLNNAYGQPIVLETPFKAGVITQTGIGSSNELFFEVYPLVIDRNDVNPGEYSATVTFEMSYL
ncbi:P pilus assembly protein, pilin FimA [Serratia rubidaea]|uniref:P pilus assembly protein, pilin FimA n=1 Tax=Serratia rubidaea TaxID=61652 RepID=A0A4V6YXY0_SERRU|nr:fimbrial protein [Serratia rubidaea]QPR64357.1 type 1 fimbrial protein [Serratia rubidaea]CAI1076689.1 P pilus assembly protein, pilin FimA [Serratia rubidaea]CAI1889632.1 P pilus assembly protein, pilin FimA [Serratia rubidaea]VTP67203.1 P pilus assembly protein, pilin FimA [Serratia rubidaea]HAY0638432.1 type 1 fimbrial protein [Serratia rubidaea]